MASQAITGKRLVRIGNAPAHHHHQIETECEEAHRGDSILQTDHLVVGGKYILRPEPLDVVMIVVVGIVPGV